MTSARARPLRSASRHLACLALFAAVAGSVPAQQEPEWIDLLPLGTSLSSGFADMAVDASGVTYVTGTTGAGTSTDVVTSAIAPDGTLLWSDVFDGPAKGGDQARGLTLGPGGVLWVTGNTPGPGSFANVLLLQYDAATGTRLAVVQYSSGAFTSEHGASVATDAAGNVYVVGGTVGDGSDALVAKFGPDGTLAWKRTWDGPAFGPFSQDHGQQVAVAPDGNVLALIDGVMASLHADYVVVKYDAATGATLWTATWGQNGDDYPAEMELDAAGDVYVTGVALDFHDKFGTIKLRGTDGQLLWQAYDSAGFRDVGRALALDGRGGVVITGSVDPDGDISNFNDNVYTVKRDASSGAQVWTRLYGANCVGCLDLPSDVLVDGAGHAYVGGSTSSPPYTNDMITFVLDAGTGVELERRLITGGPGNTAASGSLAFDAEENLFNAGRTYDPNNGAVGLSDVKYTTLSSAKYALEATLLVGGSGASFTLRNATPEQLQYLLFGLAGTASIPVPSLGISLGVAAPQLLALGAADAAGGFGVPLLVPAGAQGVTAWFQGVQKHGATPVVKRTVQ